ncbi:hypothetical protein N9955_00635 [bacterium]|nr:hypothetical protein [bacterium]
MEMIYHSRKEALDAVHKYFRALEELQHNLGIREEIDDSCCNIYAYAKYFHEGKIEEVGDTNY